MTCIDISVPFYTVTGNHDVWHDGQEPYFVSRFGAVFQTFVHNNIQFFMLENAKWFSDSTNWLTQTEVIDSQLVWLSDQLASSTSEYKVVMAHKPWWDPYVVDSSIIDCALHDTMKTYGVDLILTGHYHNYFYAEYDGIKTVIGGRSGGGSTLGHPVFSAKDVRYVTPDVEPHQYLIVTVEDSISITLDRCIECPEFDDGDSISIVNAGCDICPGFDDAVDVDYDGIPDGCDNCLFDFNPDQSDFNNNGKGDACDSVATDIEDLIDISNIPNLFEISQNYPNPFNPTTEISFSLASSSETQLEVFNILGQVITKVIYGKLKAGTYSYKWDGATFGSGVYIYKLTAGDFIGTKKMMLLK